jgi:N-formylglutamate amidohydrolase
MILRMPATRWCCVGQKTPTWSACTEFAPALGVAWVEALFPRSYLDANRDVTEVDVDMLDGPWAGPVASDERVLSKVRLGKGLVWRMTDDGKPIYSRQLGVAEVERALSAAGCRTTAPWPRP